MDLAKRLLISRRIAIRRTLQEYGGDEKKGHYRKAKCLVGVVESGLSDLGQNHRDHLIKKIKGAN